MQTIASVGVNESNYLRSSFLWLCGILAFFMLSEHAHAAVGGGGSLPYESWLTNLRDSATGPIAFRGPVEEPPKVFVLS